MRRRPGLGTLAAAGAALAVAAITAKGRGRELDEQLFKRVNRGSGPAADRFFHGVTELGSFWAAAGGAAALAASGRRRTAADALGAATAAWLLGQGLKKRFLRARPYDALEDLRLMIGRPRGTSWPSSHPMVLLTFLTVAARDLGVPRGARAALAALPGAVAASRVYLGVHYPSDVAGGLLLGRATADVWSAAVSPSVLRASR
jgi:membrane-associated phospholipid phosphatase